MTEDDAWALEERFWLEGPTVYGAHLDSQCLMAFPGIGVLQTADIIAAIKGAPRWESVNMTDRHVGRPGTDLLVLGYIGAGHRSGFEPIAASVRPLTDLMGERGNSSNTSRL